MGPEGKREAFVRGQGVSEVCKEMSRGGGVHNQGSRAVG